MTEIVAMSELAPAIPLSVVSIMKKAFCALMVKKVSITTPINEDTIAPPPDNGREVSEQVGNNHNNQRHQHATQDKCGEDGSVHADETKNVDFRHL